MLGEIVHCFNRKKLESLVRPAIVTGFLGYSLVCIGLLLDLGRPHKGWHAFTYLNLLSPVFVVALCVMSHTAVALLELLTAVFEKFGFHNLWYNPILPLLFWIAAVFTGMYIIIIEAVMVHPYLHQPEETDLLATLTRFIPWFLGIYLALKIFALFYL